MKQAGKNTSKTWNFGAAPAENCHRATGPGSGAPQISVKNGNLTMRDSSRRGFGLPGSMDSWSQHCLRKMEADKFAAGAGPLLYETAVVIRRRGCDASVATGPNGRLITKAKGYNFDNVQHFWRQVLENDCLLIARSKVWFTRLRLGTLAQTNSLAFLSLQSLSLSGRPQLSYC
ncbi:hypothetical protein R3P38DRAFT_2796203 [Favolaschia claudopus]|uniref:Uncharacterized protein n=1 Tax=Favolaschia claudopus TaxID=2862362 RepID=A0AAW0A5N0_9AGAR